MFYAIYIFSFFFMTCYVFSVLLFLMILCLSLIYKCFALFHVFFLNFLCYFMHTVTCVFLFVISIYLMYYTSILLLLTVLYSSIWKKQVHWALVQCLQHRYSAVWRAQQWALAWLGGYGPLHKHGRTVPNFWQIIPGLVEAIPSFGVRLISSIYYWSPGHYCWLLLLRTKLLSLF